MNCFDCNKKIENESESILIDDGVFVCNDNCKKEYEKKKEDFFNRIIIDKNIFTRWMSGDDV